MTQKPLKGFALMILGLTSFHKWVIIFLCYFWFHFRQTLLCIYIKYHENIQTSMFWPQTKDIWLIGVCATQPLVCKGKPQVSMTTLCSTAVPTAVPAKAKADIVGMHVQLYSFSLPQTVCLKKYDHVDQWITFEFLNLGFKMYLLVD